MNIFSLAGKKAIVVGGGSGLGKAIAIGLSSQGADVALAGRSADKLSEATFGIESAGGKAISIVMDISDTASSAKGVGECAERLGGLDILVNSAACHIKMSSMEMTPEEWSFVMDTNLKGVFFTCQAAARVMKDNDGGSIINISSINGIRPFPDTLAYCTSKSGVIMMTKSLACDWAKYGIRVNAIAPGVIPTDLNREALKTPGRSEAIVAATALGRLGREDEVTGAAVYLASDASRYVTGETIAVDGGFLAKGI